MWEEVCLEVIVTMKKNAGKCDRYICLDCVAITGCQSDWCICKDCYTQPSIFSSILCILCQVSPPEIPSKKMPFLDEEMHCKKCAKSLL